MNEPEYTSGKFVTKKKTQPAIVVDCSHWVDTSTGDWTFGTVLNKQKARPAIQSKEHIPALRLEILPQSGVTLQELQQLTIALIQKLVEAAPEQNLDYDTQLRNRTNDLQGTLAAFIVMVPKTPTSDIDEVYQELSELARKTAADLNVEVVDSREQVTR